tara:strand:- start:90 stop:392 length:303 start_codon:yes stop_codon:yes gene_type:complete
LKCVILVENGPSTRNYHVGSVSSPADASTNAFSEEVDLNTLIFPMKSSALILTALLSRLCSGEQMDRTEQIPEKVKKLKDKLDEANTIAETPLPQFLLDR